MPAPELTPMGFTPHGQAIIFGLATALAAVLGFLAKEIWAKVFGAARAKEISRDAIEAFRQEISTELQKGSLCFQEIDVHLRTLADVAHALCRTVEQLAGGEDLGCEDLKAIIRGSHEHRS